MKTGQVQWFDPDTGEGIIQDADGEEIKVRSSAIVPPENKAYSRIKNKSEVLPSGATVNFEIADEENLTAEHVIQLS